MNSLSTELYQIASSPQAKLNPQHREAFELYIRDFHDSAEHGNMIHAQYAGTPSDVSKALFENGFSEKLVDGKKFFSWENPKGELAMKLYNLSSLPWTTLSEEDKRTYFKIVRESKRLANEGKFCLEVPSSTSPEVIKALDISATTQQSSIYLCWGAYSD